MPLVSLFLVVIGSGDSENRYGLFLELLGGREVVIVLNPPKTIASR